ncbi:FecR domain-containing protein, partial [Thermodesulfobacteriota bacterium]
FSSICIPCKAYYARKGDRVYEKDILYSLENCRSRILFNDKNVVMLAQQTQLSIEEVHASLIAGEKRSRFRMIKGRAIFYALRLLRYPKMKLELRTSTAAVGIRGTKFGTEIETEKALTRVYVFEGQVEVTSLIDGRVQALRINEVLEADSRGLGDVKFDPAATRGFMESVNGEPASSSTPESKRKEQDFHREDMDRTEKVMDIQQQELGHDKEQYIRSHEQQGGSGHP